MKRRSIAIAASALLLSMIVPSPAQAAPGAIEFTCSGVLPEWPALGEIPAPDCLGTAFGTTTTSICALGCDFQLTIDSYDDFCLLTEPSQAGVFSGRMFLDGTYFGSYAATRLGSHPGQLVFAGQVIGHGTFTPEIPFGTCDTPGEELTYLMTGTVVGIAQ